jgi:hypothetical protein
MRLARGEVVALFDSGVDPLHEVFGGRAAGSDEYEQVYGLPLDRLCEIRSAAIAGELDPDVLDDLEHRLRWTTHGTPGAVGLLPGRDFAGLHPSSEPWDGSRPGALDINGHGTAAAGLLARAGLRVLPVKVGYALAAEISLPGLVDACEWLAEQVDRGLPCRLALWPFGSTDPAAKEIYQELVEFLAHAGVEVVASGRGVFESVAAPDERLYPADLDTVLAVDETLTLAAYQVETPDGVHEAFLTPWGPGGRSRHLRAGWYDVLAASPEGGWTAARRASEVSMVTGREIPYVFRRDCPGPRGPVLVVREAVPLPARTRLRIAPAGTRTFRSNPESTAPHTAAPTGSLAPAALAPRDWIPTFGSSCAAPAAVAGMVAAPALASTTPREEGLP